MSNLGPDRTLIRPPRSDDIFDSNYHPDLDAQDELYFQAYRDAGLGSRTRESKSRAHANVTLGKLLLVLFDRRAGSILCHVSFCNDARP